MDILNFGAKCVASIGVEPEKKECHPQYYIDLLKKYEAILKPNFKEAKTKHNVEHSIITKGPPCTAKARPILPGSHKAVEGFKAWQELVKLGIVERVSPDKANTWVSPLHFVPKPDGSLRPVGDYRDLNKTETDLYPLPNLRDWVHEIAGYLANVTSGRHFNRSSSTPGTGSRPA